LLQEFKALGPDQAGGVAGLNSKENAEFDSQRKDAIEEASKAASQKIFGGGSKDIKEAENPRKRREPKSKLISDEKTTPEVAGNGQGILNLLGLGIEPAVLFRSYPPTLPLSQGILTKGEDSVQLTSSLR